MKRNRLFVVALIVALSATPLVPTSSNVSSYDPWLDLNDDGVIDVNDLYILASIYSSSGESINKTELLLELQARIDSLNASLLTDYYNKSSSHERFVNITGDTMTGTLNVYSSARARGAQRAYGVMASGTDFGGYFNNTVGTGSAFLGWGDIGVEGWGDDYGGYFEDTNSTGYAYLGYGDVGIEAYGSDYGGYFEDTNSTGRAYLAFNNSGIDGFGSDYGGRFMDPYPYAGGQVLCGYDIWGLWTDDPVWLGEIYGGDIVFQKDGEELWRMFEDEDGLYVESLKSGKVYSFVLQEVESGKLVESNNSNLKLSGLHINATTGLAGLVIALGLVFGLVRYRAKNNKEETDAQQTKLSQWQ